MPVSTRRIMGTVVVPVITPSVDHPMRHVVAAASGAPPGWRASLAKRWRPGPVTVSRWQENGVIGITEVLDLPCLFGTLAAGVCLA